MLKNKAMYKNIETAVVNFDRHFDNTVVDTYAFDKVIQSDEVKNTIYHYLNDSNLDMINKLIVCKEAVSTFIISEVTELYQHNHHTVYNSEVYDDYIDKLFERILIH